MGRAKACDQIQVSVNHMTNIQLIYFADEDL